MSDIHNVMVILEAKPGQEEALKKALAYVAKLSRQEDSCLTYRVYQDKEQPTQFGLYEQWKNQMLHQEQFTKPYILEFAKQAESLLAKPYLGIFGKEVEV